jgi:hypothetical protein
MIELITNGVVVTDVLVDWYNTNLRKQFATFSEWWASLSAEDKRFIAVYVFKKKGLL